MKALSGDLDSKEAVMPIVILAKLCEHVLAGLSHEQAEISQIYDDYLQQLVCLLF